MPRLTLNEQAACCYEAVRALRDDNPPTWKNLPRPRKDAEVDRVKSLRTGVTAEQAHVAYATEQLRAGVDPETLSAYESSIEDELYAAIVRTLASH